MTVIIFNGTFTGSSGGTNGVTNMRVYVNELASYTNMTYDLTTDRYWLEVNIQANTEITYKLSNGTSDETSSRTVTISENTGYLKTDLITFNNNTSGSSLSRVDENKILTFVRSDAETSIQISELNFYYMGTKLDLSSNIEQVSSSYFQEFHSSEGILKLFDNDTNTKMAGDQLSDKDCKIKIYFKNAIKFTSFSYTTADDHDNPNPIYEHPYRAPRTFKIRDDDYNILLSVNNYDTSVLGNKQETEKFNTTFTAGTLPTRTDIPVANDETNPFVWGYVNGANDGKVNYNVPTDPIWLKAPEGKQLVLSHVEYNTLSSYRIPTYLNEIKDLDEYLKFTIGLNINGGGWGGLGYKSDLNDTWAHTTRDYVVYVEDLTTPLWRQIGNEIDSVFSSKTITSTAMNGDGTIFIAGVAASNEVKVFKYTEETNLDGTWKNGSWSQMGNTLTGTGNFGQSVSINKKGNVIAIGAPNTTNNTGGTKLNAGSFETYFWNGSDWSSLNGASNHDADQNVGYSVSLNDEGNKILAGGPGITDTSGTLKGTVFYYEHNGQSWSGQQLIGSTMAVGDQWGYSVKISGDGYTFAISGPGKNSNAGNVHIFRFEGSTLRELDDPLLFSGSSGDQSGYKISLNKNGNILAISAPFDDDNATDSGEVRVYRISGLGGTWTQLGTSIKGNNEGENVAEYLDLNASGNILAIGTKQYDGEGNWNLNDNRGIVRVYKFDTVGGDWELIGKPIESIGSSAQEELGVLSLSDNGKRLITGLVGYDSDLMYAYEIEYTDPLKKYNILYFGNVGNNTDSEISGLDAQVYPLELTELNGYEKFYGPNIIYKLKYNLVNDTIIINDSGVDSVIFTNQGGNKYLATTDQINRVNVLNKAYLILEEKTDTVETYNYLTDDKGLNKFLKLESLKYRKIEKFGESISLSKDGKKVLVGIPGCIISYTPNVGRAVLYSYNDTTNIWEIEETFNGINGTHSLYGLYVKINPDGNSIGIRYKISGGSTNDDGGQFYRFKSNSWTLFSDFKDGTIDGNSNSGVCNNFDFTSDGNNLWFGRPFYTSATNIGRAYNYSSLLTDSAYATEEIFETASTNNSYYGRFISSNGDGSIVLVGEPGNDEGGTDTGKINVVTNGNSNVYSFIGTINDKLGMVKTNEAGDIFVSCALTENEANVTIYYYKSSPQSIVKLIGPVIKIKSFEDNLSESYVSNYIDISKNLLIVSSPLEKKVFIYRILRPTATMPGRYALVDIINIVSETPNVVSISRTGTGAISTVKILVNDNNNFDAIKSYIYTSLSLKHRTGTKVISQGGKYLSDSSSSNYLRPEYVKLTTSKLSLDFETGAYEEVGTTETSRTKRYIFEMDAGIGSGNELFNISDLKVTLEENNLLEFKLYKSNIEIETLFAEYDTVQSYPKNFTQITGGDGKKYEISIDGIWPSVMTVKQIFGNSSLKSYFGQNNLDGYYFFTSGLEYSGYLTYDQTTDSFYDSLNNITLEFSKNIDTGSVFVNTLQEITIVFEITGTSPGTITNIVYYDPDFELLEYEYYSVNDILISKNIKDDFQEAIEDYFEKYGYYFGEQNDDPDYDDEVKVDDDEDVTRTFYAEPKEPDI